MIKVNFEKLKTLSFHTDEAYKTLRTNIQFCGSEVKVITFTSCMQNEGKSTVAFQLAYTMAAAYKKVLIIDADIRKSVMLSRHQVDKKVKGLSEFLSGQCKAEECLCETNEDNLHIIFAGAIAPNPSELLASQGFGNLLENLRGEYDYIFVDCPPLGSVIDAAVVANISDGAILVIEAEAVSYKMAQNVKKQLQKSECRILGAVLNKVDIEGKSYYGGYYNKKYYGKKHGRGYRKNMNDYFLDGEENKENSELIHVEEV